MTLFDMLGRYPSNIASNAINYSEQEQALLQQLKDIQTPDPIGLWPLSLNAWLLITGLIATCALTSWFIHYWRRKQRYRKPAKHIVQKINLSDTEKAYADINAVLKRVILAEAPQLRHQTISLWGSAFLNFLFNAVPNTQQLKLKISPSSFQDFELLSLNAQQFEEQQQEELIQLYQNFALAWLSHFSVNQLRKSVTNDNAIPNVSIENSAETNLAGDQRA